MASSNITITVNQTTTSADGVRTATTATVAVPAAAAPAKAATGAGCCPRDSTPPCASTGYSPVGTVSTLGDLPVYRSVWKRTGRDRDADARAARHGHGRVTGHGPPPPVTPPRHATRFHLADLSGDACARGHRHRHRRRVGDAGSGLAVIVSYDIYGFNGGRIRNICDQIADKVGARPRKGAGAALLLYELPHCIMPSTSRGHCARSLLPAALVPTRCTVHAHGATRAARATSGRGALTTMAPCPVSR